MAWPDLCRWIADNAPTAPTKEALPLIKLATFTGDHRSNATLESVYGVEGDYDAGAVQPADVAERLRAAGIEALVYTTPSHRPDAPRWRVLCPLSGPMPADQRHEMVARLNGVLGGILAKESFTDSQPYYVGAVDGGEPVQCIRVSGAPLDTLPGIVPHGPPAGSDGQRIAPGAGERAPSYQMALDALRHRDPVDMDRGEWLLLSGSFHAATAGLVYDAQALSDWQAWQADYPDNDVAANARAWAHFSGSGTAGDWRTLASVSRYPQALAWATFKGAPPPPPPAGARVPRARTSARRRIDASNLFVRVGEMQIQPTDWLIDGLLEADAVAVTFGDLANGKSFVELDKAACIATGTDFHGHKVKQGTVFYIAGEGHNGIRKRLSAWEDYRGVSLSEAPLFVTQQAVQFLNAESAAMVREAVGQLANVHGVPRLIIIDTLNRNFGPGDENSTADMTTFFAAIDTLRGDYEGCTATIVHHTGHGDKDRARGSIVLPSNADIVYKVEKRDDTITMYNNKMKNSAEPPSMSFKLVAAGPSAALECVGEGGKPTGRLSPLEELALDCVLAQPGEAVAHDAWRARFFAARADKSDDTNRNAFKRAVGKLVSVGIMEVDGENYRRAPMPGMPPPR